MGVVRTGTFTLTLTLSHQGRGDVGPGTSTLRGRGQRGKRADEGVGLGDARTVCHGLLRDGFRDVN